MGQARWIQGEGPLILTGQNNEHLSTSRTSQDSGRSFIGDEVDSAWSIHRRAGQKVSKDSTADGSPDSDTPTRGDSSILTTDRGATAFTTKVSSAEEGRMSSGQGSMEAGEGLSPGGGGGAFMVFRRDTAKQQTTPTQHTLVRCSYLLSSGEICRVAKWAGPVVPVLFPINSGSRFTF